MAVRPPARRRRRLAHALVAALVFLSLVAFISVACKPNKAQIASTSHGAYKESSPDYHDKPQVVVNV